MKAPKISHTVPLEKPESAQFERGVRRLEARLRELGRAEEHPLREHGHQGHRDKADRRAGHRLEHEPDDDAGEDREEVPGVLRAVLPGRE